jgi:hypothetical protein
VRSCHVLLPEASGALDTLFWGVFGALVSYFFVLFFVFRGVL